ncbi:hypothetical protein Tco_1198147 [Tanacetum coccineum]
MIDTLLTMKLHLTGYTACHTSPRRKCEAHGELITIFGAVVKPTLDELLALWLSYSWIYDALAIRLRYINKVSVRSEVCKPWDVLSLDQRSDLGLGSVVTGSEGSEVQRLSFRSHISGDWL